MKKRIRLFTIATAITIMNCNFLSCQNGDSSKESLEIKEDTSGISLYDLFKDMESDSSDECFQSKDSILNGRTLYFFWYSKVQKKREELDAMFPMTKELGQVEYGVIACHYVNGNEYTEITNNMDYKNNPDYRLVAVGDSSTPTELKTQYVDLLKNFH